MKYLLSIVLAAVVIAAGSCSRPNGPADGENSSVVSYASTSDTTAVQSETVNQTESSITVDSSTTTTNSGGNAMTTTTARTTTTTPKQSMSTTAGANPTESKTFELYLEQYHPGIPGFDARYTLRAEYDGLPVRAADIQYSCSLSDVRIDNNQVTIPESVRNQGQAVTITGKHINGAVRELSIPMRQWKIAFEDDFEGDALDTSKWAPFEVGVDYGGDSVTVEDCYEIGDGVLSLKVNNEPVTIGGKTFSLTSAAISTYRAFSLKNGCFLASIKVPKEAGVNSAFWLMPKPYIGWGRCYSFYSESQPNIGCGEIDILEYSNAWNGKYQTTEHFWNRDTGAHHSDMAEGLVENITTEFHVYGAVIEEDAAYYYCDGELVKVNDDVTMTGEGNKRSLESFMLLSLHIGPREGGWLGAWDFDDSAFPLYMDVDWVRAYE